MVLLYRWRLCQPPLSRFLIHLAAVAVPEPRYHQAWSPLLHVALLTCLPLSSSRVVFHLPPELLVAVSTTPGLPIATSSVGVLLTVKVSTHRARVR